MQGKKITFWQGWFWKEGSTDNFVGHSGCPWKALFSWEDHTTLGAACQSWNCRRKPQRKDGEVRKRERCGEVGRSWERLVRGNSWKICFIYSVDKRDSSSINNNYSPWALWPQTDKGFRCGDSSSHTSLPAAWLLNPSYSPTPPIGGAIIAG